MLTQADVGDHLGLSQQQTSAWLSRLGLTVDAGLDAIRIAYIEALRRAAAAQAPSEDREGLLRARRQLAEIEVLRAAGVLVEAAGVVRPIEEILGQVKSGIEVIADRKAAVLAAETNVAKVHRILSDEFRAVFTECSRRCEALAAELAKK